MLLSVGIVEGDCVRCRYHGWQYDESGQCVDQPAEPKSFAAKVQIASYPVEEYFGFIWVYLGESPVPELPRWPELEEYGRFHVVELRKWNYFHDLENTVDDVHQFWVHKTGVYQDDGMAGEIPEIAAESTDFGLTQTSRFTSGLRAAAGAADAEHAVLQLGRRCAARLQELPVERAGRRREPPDVLPLHRRAPAAGRRSRGGSGRTGRPANIWPSSGRSTRSLRAVLSGRERWEDIEERPDQVLIEDGIVLLGQGVLPDRSLNRLGSSDAAIILLRKLYARELAAIEADRPLTKFPTPDAAALARLDG